MVLIPLTNQPNQSFRAIIPLPEKNIPLDFSLFWNRMADYWQLTVADGATGDDLITALPLLSSKAPVQNLLRQYGYMGIGSAYIIPISNEVGDSPGIDDWGKNFIFLWGPNE